MAKAKDEPEDDAAEGEEAEGSGGIRLAEHPRAMRSIARARAWGALAGFAIAAYLSHKAGLTFVDLVIRSIGIGIASYLMVWAASQAIWKQIVFAELAARRKEAAEKQAALLEELQNHAGEGDGTN
jgi:hypothetical protein